MSMPTKERAHSIQPGRILQLKVTLEVGCPLPAHFELADHIVDLTSIENTGDKAGT